MNSSNQTWQAALIARYPHLFNQELYGRVIAPGYPTTGDGWQDLVRRAVERIAAAVSEAPGSLRITQIKEKFGTLRLYTWAGTGFTDVMDVAVNEAIELAEARSACTCEKCGSPGRLFKSGGWYLTACDEHGKGEPVRERPRLENLRLTRRVIDGKRVVSARRYIRETDSFVEIDPYPFNLDEE
ncbi:MAG: hypothetical protein WDN50_07915 [Bradyrhizobium sp.]